MDGFFFGYGCGLEEGGLAEGKAKKCPGDTFLARGRVHGWQAASGTGVDCHPFFCTPGYEHLIPVPKRAKKAIKKQVVFPVRVDQRRRRPQSKSSQRWRQLPLLIPFSLSSGEISTSRKHHWGNFSPPTVDTRITKNRQSFR